MRRLRRWLARHRRALAAGFLALATATGLLVLAPHPASPETRPVVVASRDLPAGSTVHAADLRVLRVAPGSAAHGAFADPASVRGQVLAGDVRALEPVTDVRLLRAPLVSGDDLVMTAVRLADADAAALLRTGDRVDVLAATVRDVALGGAAAAPAVTVARAVRVLALPRPPGGSGGSLGVHDQGALVVLAATAAEARALAGADASARLSVLVLH